VPPTSYTIVANSTFLDAFGAASIGAGDPTGALQALTGNTANSVEVANGALANLLGYPGQPAPLHSVGGSGDLVNVAIMLTRAAPQSTLDALLNGDWADRQTAIAAQGEAIWSTFGADPTLYASTQQAILEALDIPLDRAANPFSLATQQGYTANAENRTIWMTLKADEFNTLFNSKLLGNSETYAWTGPLSLPSTIAPGTVAGLWFEQNMQFGNPVPGAPPAPITAGPVSPGNWSEISNGTAWADGLPLGNFDVNATPAAIAAYYNFPLPIGLSSPAIALVESGLMLERGNLLTALNQYRQVLGLQPLSPDELQLIGDAALQQPMGGGLGELTLDISVVSGVAPNSAIWLYGNAANTDVTPFQAYQNVFFDSLRNPEILSSSWGSVYSMTAQSPFQRAWQQLFVDGMLSGVSVHIAVGDQGSNGFQNNGTGNGPSGTAPTYALVVGGTSISAPYSAANDVTLGTAYQLAMQNDPATVYELVAAGLIVLPSKLSTADPNTLTSGAWQKYAGELTHLIESVWNQYAFVPDGKRDLFTDFTYNQAGSGGVDPTQPVPFYQSAFGLTPGLTPASPGGAGRGAPDVSALAGGDGNYMVLDNDYITGKGPLMSPSGGTSAAAPLWATLTSQFNVIFKDQGLPSLGFYNDLLYIAAAIAPASFNDLVLGNNNSGFYFSEKNSGYITANQTTGGEQYIHPTGAGYDALPGYDLATGLGTPNGLLLGRALAQVAHEQMYFDSIDPFLAADPGAGGSTAWRAGASESLLIQASTSDSATVHVSLGDAGTTFSTGASGSFAWTSRLAQQSLQADFDPSLVTMFDRQSQGTLLQSTVGDDMHVAVTIDGARAVTPQAGISTPFGFADFTTTANAMGFNPDVRVALPVAIAETAGGASDTVAIVRLRQNGENDLAVSFFRVDDHVGTIDISGTTYRPGDANYLNAAQDRAYLTQSGAASIAGPGYGQFGQTGLVNVDAGDIIAMMLTNNTTGQTFWSFARANEKVNGQDVGHLWNYGLNTWGFEDTWGGGDRDYNDLVIGLDFISAAGSGYLL